MFQINDEDLRELGYNNLSEKEKEEQINEVWGAILEKVIEKLRPIVPDMDKLLNEVKEEFKQEMKVFRSSGLENSEKFNKE